MTTQTRPGATSTRPVTDPAQLHDAFMAATNAHDVEALLALYEPDGTAVQLDGSLASGPTALRAMVEGLVGAIAHIEGTTRTLHVSGGLALGSATWTAEVVLPDGSVVTQHGTTAEVQRRQPDGTWRMVIDDPLFG